MSGPLARPRIVEREAGGRSARYLALLASEVLQARAAGDAATVVPHIESLAKGGASIAAQQAIGFGATVRSEEHTSELQSLMRISYAVFCLKKKNNIN